MCKLKVVLSALWFPLTMATYIWRAFERRKDVDLWVTGPFFDDYIPWNYGMKLPREYVKIPHYPLPQNAAQTRLPASFFKPPWKPDLWLQIDAGWHLGSKPEAGVVGLVETDPHVLKGHYVYPKSYSDKVWSMQTPYQEKDELYLPYAFDPEVHYCPSLMQSVNEKKPYDACLIGLHYEQRDALVARLRSRGLNVYYSLGEVYDRYREIYLQSKIALCWSSKQDLPARFFETLAMGVPTVANRVPDQTTCGFLDETHYLGFNDLNEAEKQVMRLMVDDDLYRRIATGGHWTVHQAEHTWDARVQQILCESGLRCYEEG